MVKEVHIQGRQSKDLYSRTLKMYDSEESYTKPADRSGLSVIGKPKFADEEG